MRKMDLKKVCGLIGKYFGVIAVVFLGIGLFAPHAFAWVLGKAYGVSILSVMLGIIMFGMGMTTSLHDFALVLKQPKNIFFGVCAQYFVMPGLAFLLSKAFHLDPALTVGVVLVGTCPGGTSSNVITFMSHGDVPFSVTMTSCSTVLSPLMTPLLTWLLVGKQISFDPVGMFLSILQIVFVPIGVGLAVKNFFPKFAKEAVDYLPAVSSMVISFLIAGIIGASRNAILSSAGLILLVVMLHNVLGYLLGFAIGKLTGMSWKQMVALSIEVGMQNSGLATGLAKAHFASMPMAGVPGAIFSAWHNISGAVLAYLYTNYLNERFDSQYEEEGQLKPAMVRAK